MQHMQENADFNKVFKFFSDVLNVKEFLILVVAQQFVKNMRWIFLFRRTYPFIIEQGI